MSSKNPLISFVIITESLSDIKESCINSITSQKSCPPFEYEIIIVIFKAKSFIFKDFCGFPNTTIIRNSVDISISRAHNQGLMKATGQFICFLTGQETISQNLASMLNKELSKNEKIDIAVNPKIYFEDNLGNSHIIHNEKNYYDKIFQTNKSQLIQANTILYLNNKLFSRHFLLKNNIVFKDLILMQINFIIDTYYHAERIVGLNEVSTNFILDYTLDTNANDITKYVDIYFTKTQDEPLINVLKVDCQKLDNINFFFLMKETIFFKNLFNNIEYKEKKQVTVIVPVYNTELYIDECIKSIVQQSLKNLQIILVNDGSSDHSGAILSSWMKKSSDIHLVDISTPSGHPGVPRNIALCLAHSEYVGFVDSDDWIDQNMMYDLYNYANKNNLDICSTSGYYRVDKDKEITQHQFQYISKNHSDDWGFLKNKFFSNIWNRIYKTDLLLKHGIYFPNLYLSEDLCFSAIAHYFASSSGSILQSYYYYRYNLPNSTTNQRQGEKGFSILDDFSYQLRYLYTFNFQEQFILNLLQKQLDSFWYTHDRLDPILQPLFKIKLREILDLFANKIKFDDLTPDTRGRLKKLMSTNFDQDDIDMAKRGLDLYRLKIGHNFQLQGNYVLAKQTYTLISDERLRFFNNFIVSILNSDIIWAKLYLSYLEKYNIEYNLCKDSLLNFYNKNFSEKTSDDINNSNILLSVIVPVYNSGQYLEQCLESIINQTYKNLEIIIVNDGSSDNSVEIIKKYQYLDERIVFLNCETPSGSPGKPRNMAINIAQGGYITFVDSDDFLSKDYYEKFIVTLLESATPNDIVFASGYYDLVEGKSEKLVEYNHSNFNDKTSIFYRYHQSFTIWDKIYRTSFIKNEYIYLSELPAAVDISFVLKCYIEAQNVKFCYNNYGYHYRRESDSSVTKNKRKGSNCFFEFEAYQEIETWLKETQYRFHFKPIIDLKKISSYLYTLTLISDEYKSDFYNKARQEFDSFDTNLMIELLKKSGQTDKLSRFQNILSTTQIM